MRQIRLDDDVATLVEEYQNAEGLKSLSASANRMLRLAAGPEEEPEPAPDPPAKRVDPTVTVPRPRRARRQRLPGPSPDGRTRPTPPARPPAARPRLTAGAENRCAHPILARRGDKCGACGATLPTSASTPDHPRR